MSKSDFLFLLVIASLPIQLGKFLFKDFSFVLGIPIDYRAVTIYFTDLLIFAYLVFFLIENLFAGRHSVQNLKKIYRNQGGFLFALSVFNLYLLISPLFIANWQFPFYFGIRILEFSLFTLLAIATLKNKKVYRVAQTVLTLSLLWQSAIIFGQFIFQKSLGLWFLGERSFDSTTVGIAHAQLASSQFLRSYGTFPHPNVAAAFLVIALILASPGKLIVAASFLATFLTFSKTALLVLALSLFAQISRLRYFLVILALSSLIILIFLKLLPQLPIASISERLILTQASLDIAARNPFFGVGSGNFILELAKFNLFSLSEVRLLQPVHNVFLLILAENGLIGLLLFIYLLIAVFKNAHSKAQLALFMAILIFASADHFFWTLTQGRLLLSLTIAFVLSSPKPASS